LAYHVTGGLGAAVVKEHFSCTQWMWWFQDWKMKSLL